MAQINYRKLKQIVINDRFLLPLIDDEIDKLQEARFTTLYLRNGFLLVTVTEGSRKYTDFIIAIGLYEIRAPFGLCNSLEFFMRFIANIFKAL